MTADGITEANAAPCGGSTPGWRTWSTDINNEGSAHCCHAGTLSEANVQGIRIWGRTDARLCRSQKLKVELFTATGATKTWTNVDAVGTRSSGQAIGGGVILGFDDAVAVTKIVITRDFSSGDCEGLTTNHMNLCEVQLLGWPQ